MTKRIFRSILLAAAAVLLGSLIIIMGCLYSYFGGVQEKELKQELLFAAAAVESEGMDYLTSLPDSSTRITWIAADGTVLFDSEADAAQMENHGDREEVREALRSGSGSSTRYSATLTEKTLYRASRLSDGTVLRASIRQAAVVLLVLGMIQPILLVALLAVVLSAVLARRMAKKITEPFNALDLDHPLENDTYEELAPMLGRINRQRQELALRLSDLQKKTDEFAQVTAHMREGLVLLDENGTILSINPAAQKLFGAGRQSAGQDFLTVDRSHEMRTAMEQARSEGHSEVRMARAGREYQFDLSRISSGGKAVGTVLLAFDVTERVYAERNRREFTANVSHELKTPLQSVLGSAELIEQGLVKPEDLPRFAGHIRTEAARLLTLIEDIIRLSQLDEGEVQPCETVDLGAVAAEAAAALQDAAAAKEVSLTLQCEPVTVSGVRRLLYEIVYNLCDNAVKYNVAGGSVSVTVAAEPSQAVLTVSDTGIGIPEEHQSRVFERFYRVDKSHSKESGGTGLGLSIVRHAAQYHHAAVALQSRPGEGTTVTVAFPRQS